MDIILAVYYKEETEHLLGLLTPEDKILLDKFFDIIIKHVPNSPNGRDLSRFKAALSSDPDVPSERVYVDCHPLSEMALKGSTHIRVLDEEEIEGVRTASKLGREVLDIVAGALEVGITTDEIDLLVHEACIDRECYPSLSTTTASPSPAARIERGDLHGIPDLRPLQDGDLLNVDITVYHRGFHGDLNETFLIGHVDDVGKRLVHGL
ncbi:BMS1 [Cordylochernes scorpioides]|uniref:BMS1 n=1 Tax=Cordylochernes scorpioides TaxID=51811 RepID=A0ABY6K2S3_9ARAC|nr:BMS1 [Cordylochernes scorpioides]